MIFFPLRIKRENSIKKKSGLFQINNFVMLQAKENTVFLQNNYKEFTGLRVVRGCLVADCNSEQC